MARVLIIDDDMQMRFYVMTLVKSIGAEPVLAKDGDEGLDILKKMVPDVIVLDIMMPKKGGTLVYTSLKRHKTLKDIPIVFFSGVDKGAFFHHIRMLNATRNLSVPEPEYYVAKNADPQYLKSVLEKCLKQDPGG